MTRPTLIACSHGTAFEDGRRAIRGLIGHVRAILPDVPVERRSSTCRSRRSPRSSVRSPHPDPRWSCPSCSRPATTRGSTSPAPCGRSHTSSPHPPSVRTICSRSCSRIDFAEAGLRSGDAIVLSAAGSSDPAAEADVRKMALRMADLLHGRRQRRIRRGRRAAHRGGDRSGAGRPARDASSPRATCSRLGTSRTSSRRPVPTSSRPRWRPTCASRPWSPSAMRRRAPNCPPGSAASGYSRSGRRSCVRSRLCSRRHFAIAPWLPLKGWTAPRDSRHTGGLV